MQVGDGTTTVVILAGEFLRESKPFVEEGVHPQSLIRSFRQAGELAVQRVKDLSISIDDKSEEEKKDMLKKCAMTSLNSKLVQLNIRLSYAYSLSQQTSRQADNLACSQAPACYIHAADPSLFICRCQARRTSLHRWW